MHKIAYYNTILDAHAGGVGKSFVFSTCSKTSFPRPVDKRVSTLARAQPSLLNLCSFIAFKRIVESYDR